MVLSRSIPHDLGAAVAIALVTSSFLPEKSRQVPQNWHKPYWNTPAAPGHLAAAAPPQPHDKHRRGNTDKSFSTLNEGLFQIAFFRRFGRIADYPTKHSERDYQRFIFSAVML
jgi:hypothetical protein